MKTIIGEYGEMARSLMSNSPGSLSFRNPKYDDLESWRAGAVETVLECVASPGFAESYPIKAVVENKYEWDGLDAEELSWHFPFGRRRDVQVLDSFEQAQI